jgi:hypothetical protein
MKGKVCGWMEEAPFIVKVVAEIESGLREQVGKTSINDEEDFKDLVNEICVNMDPELMRDQITQSYIGAYTVDFILWHGLVAIEARLIKSRTDLDRILPELVSHIPVFGAIYRDVIFVILYAEDATDDPAKIKKSLESRSDQLRIIMMEKKS